MIQLVLYYSFALVWLVNGLFFKILNLVPRHHAIVSRLLGTEHAHTFTFLIGSGEVIMSIWVISHFRPKWCGFTQIVLVLTMNLIEFFMVPELLLWGRLNLVFALLFCTALYYHYFRNPYFPKLKKNPYF